MTRRTHSLGESRAAGTGTVCVRDPGKEERREKSTTVWTTHPGRHTNCEQRVGRSRGAIKCPHQTSGINRLGGSWSRCRKVRGWAGANIPPAPHFPRKSPAQNLPPLQQQLRNNGTSLARLFSTGLIPRSHPQPQEGKPPTVSTCSSAGRLASPLQPVRRARFSGVGSCC